MRGTMKITGALSWLLLIGCGAQASPALRADAGLDARYEQAEDALALDAAGLSHKRVRRLTFVSELALDDLGDPRLAFDAETERLSGVSAQVTRADGGRAAHRIEAANETLPDAVALAPAYTSLRETVLTLLGLERGATAEYGYTVTRPGAARLDVALPVAFEHPVDSRVIQVSLPEGQRLSWRCVACPTPPEVSAVGQTTTFRWREVPGWAVREQGGMAEDLLPGQPRLLLTNATQAEFTLAADPSVAALAARLTADCALPSEKVESLWAYVAETLTTVALPVSRQLERQAPDAQAVVTRSYGHALDKARLLVSLLNAVGISAEAVLVARDEQTPADFPGLADFAEVAVRVRVDGEDWLLSPTEKTRLGLAGRLVLGEGGLRAVALTPASRRLTLTLSMDAAGALTGQGQVAATGALAPLPGVVGAEAVGALTEGVSVKADSGVLTARSWAQSAARFEVDEKLAVSGRSVALALPPSPLFAELGLERPARGTALPVQAGTDTLKVELKHEGLALAAPAPVGAVRVENAVGQVAFAWGEAAGALTLTRTVTLKGAQVSPAQYADLKALAEAAAQVPALVLMAPAPKAL